MSGQALKFKLSPEMVGSVMAQTIAESEGPKICQAIFGKADPSLMRLLETGVTWQEDGGLVISFEKSPEMANVVVFPGAYSEEPREQVNEEAPENEDPDDLPPIRMA